MCPRAVGQLCIPLFIAWATTASALPLNIAPLGTVTASASYLTSTPDKAVDENLSTLWNAGDHPVQWIEVDLGGTHDITEIRANVAQSPGGNTIHHVLFDGVLAYDWTDFTTDGQWLEHSLSTPVETQTVRIETVSSPSWVAWYELEIIADVVPTFPINVAPGGTATGSGSFFPAENAVDRDVTTMWNAGDHPPQWIEIDLGTMYLIDEIRANVAQTPDSFTEHLAFLDGISVFDWTGDTFNGQWLEHAFASPVAAQTLRIDTTQSLSWVAWNEIEVIASGFANQVAIPEPASIMLLALGLTGIIVRRRNT